MAPKLTVVDNGFTELKICSLHGNPFWGAGIQPAPKRGSHPYTGCGSTWRGSVSRVSPRANGGPVFDRGPRARARRSSRKPLPRTESLLVEHLRPRCDLERDVDI